MKWKLIAFLYLSIATLVGCGKEEVVPSKKTVSLQEEATINGLLYKMNSKKGVYAVGEPIEIISYVQNTRETSYKFDGNPCDGKLYITIQDIQGKYRLQGEGDVSPDACIEPLVQHELKPQQILKAKAIFNSDKVIKIGEGAEETLKPGKYNIEVQYHLSRWGAGTIEIK